MIETRTETLIERDAATRLGMIRLAGRAQAFASRRPLVVAIPAFVGPEGLAGAPAMVAPVAEAVLVRPPGAGGPALADASVQGLARAVGEAVEQLFADRRIVVLGLAGGAVAALGVRAPAVRRIVAVEPPLEDAACRRVLEGLAVPADVMRGGAPPAWLAACPQVRLHPAPGAGGLAQAAAGKALADLLLEACRRACADAPAGLDEALAEATPLAARRLAHWGPGGAAFARACLARNPTAEVSVLGEAADAPPPGLDAVALGAAPTPGVLRRLAEALRPGGDLVARWAAPDAAQALAAAGLQPGPAVEPGVLRARKAPGYADPPLRVEVIAFAHRLMDVRTRLPARALASDPELVVRYAVPPHVPPELAPDAPKVLVLQRPRPTPVEEHRAQIAHFIARGWLMVIEYDDHPALVAEALGRPFGPRDLERFGHVHAVQTSVEPLAALFREVNPEVRLLPNAAFDLAPLPQGEPPARVFYGAVSRGGFAVEVARSLAPVVAEFPHAEFVVLGDRAVFEALPAARKVYEDYLPYEAYLARLADCLVSLSPVEATDVRAAKSDAKFLDAARAGVPTIGSPVIYGGAIRHGETGLLAERLEDWAPMLRRALADPAAARAMGRQAWAEVRARRMFAGLAGPHRAWLRDLWRRRDALTAALFQRLPGLADAVAAERARLAGGAMGVEPEGRRG